MQTPPEVHTDTKKNGKVVALKDATHVLFSGDGEICNLAHYNNARNEVFWIDADDDYVCEMYMYRVPVEALKPNWWHKCRWGMNELFNDEEDEISNYIVDEYHGTIGDAF